MYDASKHRRKGPLLRIPTLRVSERQIELRPLHARKIPTQKGFRLAQRRRRTDSPATSTQEEWYPLVAIHTSSVRFASIPLFRREYCFSTKGVI